MPTSPGRSGPRTPGSPTAAPILIGRDCRLSSPELAAALAEGIVSQGSDVVDLGLASTDLLYFASGSLDLPGHHDHREPQPEAVQRAEVLPAGRAAGRARTRGSARSAPWSRRGSPPAQPRRRSSIGICSTPTSSTCSRFVDVRRDAAAVGRRRHRQRDGRSRRAGGARAAAGHGALPVPGARRHVPEPSGRPAQPGEPARPEGGGARGAAPTSGSRSTATPTACSCSTSAARA